MMTVIQDLSATWLDLVGLVFFLVAWLGYSAFAERRGRRVPNLHNRIDQFRREWMVRMIER